MHTCNIHLSCTLLYVGVEHQEHHAVNLTIHLNNTSLYEILRRNWYMISLLDITSLSADHGDCRPPTPLGYEYHHQILHSCWVPFDRIKSVPPSLRLPPQSPF